MERANRPLLALVGLIFALGIGGVERLPAQSVQGIVAKMIARNPTLKSYRVRVHITTHMYSFPFYSPTLDGTSYFKRPGRFVVVFDSVPTYARGFSKLFNNIGDPGAWSKENLVTYRGTTMWSGREVYVLRVAPRQYSDILAYADAMVDPSDWELVQMTWHYRDGGSITMRQWYRRVDGFNLLSEQSADIDFRVHASTHASYGAYELNVPVADTVFTGAK